MKHWALLTSGGRIEIELPLEPLEFSERGPTAIALAGKQWNHWRKDQNGILINLRNVAAITGQEPSDD